MGQENSPEVDLSNIEYVISDWDGTLVNSMEAYINSFARTLHEVFQVDQSDAARFFEDEAGKPLSWEIKEAVRRFAHKNIDNSKPYEEMFWTNLAGIKPEVMPGAKEFMENLKNQRKKMVVWSGTRTDVLGKTIETVGFSPYIDFYIGNVPGDDKLVKGPGLFAKVAEHFGEESDEMARKTLVIGDGIGDVEAGRAIGAITGGFGEPNKSDFGKADFTFSNYNTLLEMLE